MEKKIEPKLVKYVFNIEEKRQIAQELANGVAELQRIEDQKKSVMSQIKSELDSKQAQVNLKAEQFRSGFEMRRIDCERVYQQSEGVVVWYRLDNQEIAEERKMTADEKQMKFEEIKNG